MNFFIGIFYGCIINKVQIVGVFLTVGEGISYPIQNLNRDC